MHEFEARLVCIGSSEQPGLSSDCKHTYRFADNVVPCNRKTQNNLSPTKDLYKVVCNHHQILLKNELQTMKVGIGCAFLYFLVGVRLLS